MELGHRGQEGLYPRGGTCPPGAGSLLQEPGGLQGLTSAVSKSVRSQPGFLRSAVGTSGRTNETHSCQAAQSVSTSSGGFSFNRNKKPLYFFKFNFIYFFCIFKKFLTYYIMKKGTVSNFVGGH